MVVWELLMAAKTLNTPPHESTEKIVNAVKGLHQLMEKMISELSEVSGVRKPREADDDSSHEMQ